MDDHRDVLGTITDDELAHFQQLLAEQAEAEQQAEAAQAALEATEAYQAREAANAERERLRRRTKAYAVYLGAEHAIEGDYTIDTDGGMIRRMERRDRRRLPEGVVAAGAKLARRMQILDTISTRGTPD